MTTEDRITNTWKENRAKLLGFITTQVSNDADAEDILSNTFFKLINHNKNNPLPDNIVTWLYRVARNAIIDYYRTKKEVVELPESIEQEKPSTDALKSLSSCVQPIVALLPEPYRTTLQLADIELMKHKDIAKITGKSLAATKADARRAREKLLNVVADCCSIKTNETKKQVIDVEPNAPTCCKRCDP